MFKTVDKSIRQHFVLIISFHCLLVVQSFNGCAGTCIENIQLMDLNEKFDLLQAEMKSQKTEINQLKSENEELKTRLSQQDQKILKQDQKILQLENEISYKIESPGPLLKSTASCTKKVANVASKKNEKASPRALVSLPTSCEGLRKEGHFANGVYLVLNEATNKIGAVLCQFLGANQVSQDLIGQVDVKTNTVHFYVQRESSFSTPDAVIPFELEPINEGSAFNLASGVFTTPVSGIYHFDFTAVKSETVDFLWIYLQVNGDNVGIAYTAQSAIGSVDVVSLSASLRLAAGDKVNLFNLNSGVIYDAGDHLTQFTGWLVEEDLM